MRPTNPGPNRVESSPGWRLGQLLGEGVRNVWFAWARTLLLVAATVVVIAALTVSDLATTSSLLDFNRQFIAAGGRVLVATADQPTIPGWACDRLNTQSWVLAAGGFRRSDVAEAPATAPGTLYGRGEVTATIVSIWWPELSTKHGQVIVGSAAATELGLRTGSHVTLGGEPLRVAAAARQPGRHPEVERLILDLAPGTHTFSQCWIETTPGADPEAARQALEAVTSRTSSVRIDRFRQLDAFSRDVITELRVRPGNQLWWVTAVLLILLGAIQAFARRPELALHRAIGTARAEIFILNAAETLTIVLASGLMAVVWTVATWSSTHTFPETDQLRILARTVGSTLALASLGIPLVTTVISSGTIASLLKER